MMPALIIATSERSSEEVSTSLPPLPALQTPGTTVAPTVRRLKEMIPGAPIHAVRKLPVTPKATYLQRLMTFEGLQFDP